MWTLSLPTVAGQHLLAKQQVGISLNDILKTGCWSKEHTFKKFYSKNIINIDNKEMEYRNKLLSWSHIQV